MSAARRKLADNPAQIGGGLAGRSPAGPATPGPVPSDPPAPEAGRPAVSVWVPAWSRPPAWRLHGARDTRGEPAPIVVAGYDDVAAVLRAWRLARGWTQAELDARVGWADGYAGKVEQRPGTSGRRTALPATLAEWTTALAVPGIALRPAAPCRPVSLLDIGRLRRWRFWAAVATLRARVVPNPGAVRQRYAPD